MRRFSLNEREYVIYAKISGQKKAFYNCASYSSEYHADHYCCRNYEYCKRDPDGVRTELFGLGIQPPTASWGSMLSNAQRYIQQAPYLAIFPGILILITVISFNYLGEVLRKVFEPK